MLEIYVDADGCPVKDEILRVATRYDLTTTFVANAGMSLPANDRSDWSSWTTSRRGGRLDRRARVGG